MSAPDIEVSIYDITATTAQLEECFGVSKQYLGQLEKAGDIRKSARNSWVFFETVQQFVDVLKNRKTNQHDGDEGTPAEVMISYERDKARKMKADADIAEITADLMAGRVHEAKAVEELWTQGLMAARQKFLGLPSKLAAEAPAELATMVLKTATEVVREGLLQLGEYNPQQIAERTDRKRVSDPTPTADDAAMDAAAPVESEPMG